MQHFKILIHRDGVAHAHAFLSGSARCATDVNVKVVNFWCFRFTIHLLHVRGWIANYTEYAAFGIMDCYTLSFADNGIYTSHAFNPDIAVFVYVIH